MLPPLPTRAAEDHWQETLLETPPPVPQTAAPPIAMTNTMTNGATSSSRPTDESIRRRAYRLWETAGCPAGRHLFFWQEAERQLTAEARQGETITVHR